LHKLIFLQNRQACTARPPRVDAGELAKEETGMAEAATRKPRAGTRGGAAAPAISREQLTRAYRDMLLIRRFEEKAGQLYGMGLIGGFCHLYIGQEAVVVGMQAALIPATRSSPPTATTATCSPPAWRRAA
jgi:hypothetical protein